MVLSAQLNLADVDGDGIPDHLEDSDDDGIPNHMESKVAQGASHVHGPAAIHMFKTEDQCRLCADFLTTDEEGNLQGVHKGGTIMCNDCLGVVAGESGSTGHADRQLSQTTTRRLGKKWISKGSPKPQQSCGAKVRGCKWGGTDPQVISLVRGRLCSAFSSTTSHAAAPRATRLNAAHTSVADLCMGRCFSLLLRQRE